MDLRIYNIKLSINFIFIFIIVSAFVAGLYKEITAVLLALAVHEMAHIIVGRELGLDIEELELSPFGGRIKVAFDKAASEEEILTALAGPFANFVSVGLIAFLTKLSFVSSEFSKQLIHYQLMLGFFNIIPAYPLDGGRIFSLWLRRHISHNSSVRITAKTSKILAIFFLIIAVWGITIGKIFMSLVFAGFFLFYQAIKIEKNVAFDFMKQLVMKKETVFKKKYISGDTIIVLEDTPVKDVLYLFSPQKYFIVVVMDKHMKIKKCITETEIFDKIIEKGLDLTIEDLI